MASLIEDPLKPLDLIYEPDEREAHMVGSLADRHEAIAAIELIESVPIAVRQLFETAKNLSLYSWFVYRFHQVSELVSFSAMEMALRLKYQAENPESTRRTSLHFLLQHAKKESWISNEGFPYLYERATFVAGQRKIDECLMNENLSENEEVFIDEPTEQEIQDVLNRIDLVSGITENAHKIRNDLAHGSTTLHPGSISTLRTTAGVINQLYPS